MGSRCRGNVGQACPTCPLMRTVRNAENNAMIRRGRHYVLLLAVLPLVGCEGQQTKTQTLPRRTQHTKIEGGTFRGGYMYWAPRSPVLSKAWYVVFVGTVLEVHPDMGDLPNTRMIRGTLKIDTVLLRRPARQEEFVSADYFEAAGFDGLSPGDKVVVFVEEYDGGYGFAAPLQSNCNLGIKVARLDGPVVAAVQQVIRDGVRTALQDPACADVWRRYDGVGVASALSPARPWWEVAEAVRPSSGARREEK